MRAVYRKDPTFEDGFVVRCGTRFWSCENDDDFVNKVRAYLFQRGVSDLDLLPDRYYECIYRMKGEVRPFRMYRFGEIDESEMVEKHWLTSLGIQAMNLGWIELIDDDDDDDDDDVTIEKLSTELELYRDFFNNCFSHLKERYPSPTIYSSHDCDVIYDAIIKGSIGVSFDYHIDPPRWKNDIRRLQNEIATLVGTQENKDAQQASVAYNLFDGSANCNKDKSSKMNRYVWFTIGFVCFIVAQAIVFLKG